MQQLVEDVSEREPLLMTPGPTEVSKDVLDELSRQPPLHYGAKWSEIYNETLTLMRKLFNADDSSQQLLVPAPASAVIEMAIANTVPPKGKVINFRNGYFGEIAGECSRLHGLRVEDIETTYGLPVDPSTVRAALERNPDTDAITIVHNETSTGVVNPVEKIGDIAESLGVPMIVDAVSSFGAADVSMKRWKASICIGYASKGLAGVPGVVPLAIRNDLWEKIVRTEEREDTAGRFLSFRIWSRYIEQWGSWGHPFPSTMPTSIIMALKKAANNAIEEGLPQRTARHHETASLLRRKIRNIGLTPFAEDYFASDTMTSIKMSEPMNSEVRRKMENQYKIMVSGGLSLLSGKIIRIGHMGLTATENCIQRTLDALSRSLR